MQKESLISDTRLVISRQPRVEDLPTYRYIATKIFTDLEPMLKANKVDYETFRKFYTQYYVDELHPSYNFLLEDITEKKIIGGMIAADVVECLLHPDEPKQPIPEDMPKGLQQVIHVLQVLEEKYLELRKYPKRGEVIYGQMGFMDSRYANNRVFPYCLRTMLKYGQQQGFKQCMAIVTGKYSQKAFQKMGFKVIAEYNYRDFEFEGKNIFKNITEEKIKLVELNLDEIVDEFSNLEGECLKVNL